MCTVVKCIIITLPYSFISNRNASKREGCLLLASGYFFSLTQSFSLSFAHVSVFIFLKHNSCIKYCGDAGCGRNVYGAKENENDNVNELMAIENL